ncbi:G patch domain and ankyrin repeat-containing protein 1 homolog [Melitaea cinxia]|uniref:G patch domain and ankyrin repeat-containing protein 1 homolog n=1 Tax=Melitaea cinxia TaxID=113334 RepID=UPI001E27167A|nr:G patch domain and ankyrin repeat-containing protein 1 homolog [Melitaea cinxia]
MFHKEYSNFVRPTTSESSTSKFSTTVISGETAKKLYLEEISNIPCSQPLNNKDIRKSLCKEIKLKKIDDTEISNLQLFHSVQNNDVDKVRQALDIRPGKINVLDEYGWSLLMIACQANSVEVVKELLKRGIDTTVRDKAGNSARSLVIKNRNFVLADILLRQSHINIHDKVKNNKQLKNERLKEKYVCEICDNKVFENKQEHLSSTVHNINASKGKKIPTNYVIPESNKGYQIMLKVGWDKETGLGPDGTGKKYPIKAVQKTDKKGLGHKQKKGVSSKTESMREIKINKKSIHKEYHRNRQMEINFRREFY